MPLDAITNDLVHFKLSDLESDNVYKSEPRDLKLINEQRKYLSPDARELVTRDTIRNAVKKFGRDGITVSEIAKLSGLDRKTIQKHLEKLNGLREVYSQKRSGNIVHYFPNGKPLHQIGSVRVGDENPFLDITITQGQRDALYFYIVEKSYSILEGEVSEGAVMLPVEKLDYFIEALKELKQNYEVMKYG
jgi:predicted transcriptional regulator